MNATLTKTAANLFSGHIDTATVAPLLLSLAQFAAQRPGLDYCSGWNDRDGRRAYFSEARAISRQLSTVRQELRVCVANNVTDADIRQACDRAFGGRLQIGEAGRVDYCTGQYFCTEYRRAVAAVLDAASTIAYSRNLKAAA